MTEFDRSLEVGSLQRLGRALEVKTLSKGYHQPRQFTLAGQAFENCIDISRYQASATINYSQMVSWAKLVFVKATQGTTIIDPEWATHWTRVLDNGGRVIPYHYFHSQESGVSQAEHFWDQVLPLIAELGFTPPLVVDVEQVGGVSNTTRLANLKAMLERLAELAGHDKIIIYTSPGFANTYLREGAITPAWINTYDFWIAHWTAAALPTMPLGWNPENLIFWQYGIWDTHSWCPAVPGMIPDVDVDRWFGNEAALASYYGQARAAFVHSETIAYNLVDVDGRRIGELSYNINARIPLIDDDGTWATIQVRVKSAALTANEE